MKFYASLFITTLLTLLLENPAVSAPYTNGKKTSEIQPKYTFSYPNSNAEARIYHYSDLDWLGVYYPNTERERKIIFNARNIRPINDTVKGHSYYTVVLDDNKIVNINSEGGSFLVFDASQTEGFDPEFEILQQVSISEIRSGRESCTLFRIVPGNSKKTNIKTKVFYILIRNFDGRAIQIPMDILQTGSPKVYVTKKGLLRINKTNTGVNIQKDFNQVPVYKIPLIKVNKNRCPTEYALGRINKILIMLSKI